MTSEHKTHKHITPATSENFFKAQPLHVNSSKPTLRRVSFLTCALCNVLLSAPATVKAHLNSKNHIKKAAIADGLTYEERMNQPPPVLKCDICDVTVNSIQQRDLHLRGMKHYNKTRQKTETSEIPPKKQAVATTASSSLAERTQSIAPTVAIQSSEQTEAITNETNLSESQSKCVKCTLCDILVNSSQQLKQHVQSRKHAAKENPTSAPYTERSMRGTGRGDFGEVGIPQEDEWVINISAQRKPSLQNPFFRGQPPTSKTHFGGEDLGYYRNEHHLQKSQRQHCHASTYKYFYLAATSTDSVSKHRQPPVRAEGSFYRSVHSREGEQTRYIPGGYSRDVLNTVYEHPLYSHRGGQNPYERAAGVKRSFDRSSKSHGGRNSRYDRPVSSEAGGNSLDQDLSRNNVFARAVQALGNISKPYSSTAKPLGPYDEGHFCEVGHSFRFGGSDASNSSGRKVSSDVSEITVAVRKAFSLGGLKVRVPRRAYSSEDAY